MNSKDQELLNKILEQAAQTASESLDATLGKVIAIAKRHKLHRPILGIPSHLLVYLIDYYRATENQAANQIIEQELGIQSSIESGDGGNKITMED